MMKLSTASDIAEKEKVAKAAQEDKEKEETTTQSEEISLDSEADKKVAAESNPEKVKDTEAQEGEEASKKE